jgi:hypothetical protein
MTTAQVAWNELKKQARMQGIPVHKMTQAQILEELKGKGVTVTLLEPEPQASQESPEAGSPVDAPPGDLRTATAAPVEPEPELPARLTFRVKASTRDCIDIVDQQNNTHAKVFRQGRPFRGGGRLILPFQDTAHKIAKALNQQGD